MAKDTHQTICPMKVTLCVLYTRLSAPHAWSLFTDILLYTTWKSEWIEFHNYWNRIGLVMSWEQFLTSYISVGLSLFSINIQHLEIFPSDFQIFWHLCPYLLRYSDYSLSVVSTSTNLTVSIRFSTWDSRLVNNVHSIFSNFWNIHFIPTIRLWISDNIWHHMN